MDERKSEERALKPAVRPETPPPPSRAAAALRTAPWRTILALGTLAALAGCATPTDEAVADGDPSARITAAIDETRLVTLVGNTHPKANAKYDVGPADDLLALDGMQLVLRRSPTREAALTALMDEQQDRASPLYHHWLSAPDFGDQFGVSDADVATVTAWLTSHGFTVGSAPKSRMFLEFSGTAGQVREAFHTSIHHFDVKGQRHIANLGDPRIPEALAPVVVGIHALHDFMPHPMHRDRGVARRDHVTGAWSLEDKAHPDFTIVDGGSTFYAVAPADFATIYNLNPLFSAGIRGAGQTIVVIEDTNIKNVADVTSFRTGFGLSGYAGTFTQVHPGATCINPGVNGDEGEAAIDAEWAGATAPDAAIELASCRDTATVFGGLIAVQNLVNGVSPPKIMSISYGECESENGAAANASYVLAYQQAAAEGVSVFVSSGDEGAASCDADEDFATHGIAVSGFASTPYNVAVGGTDFLDTYDAQNGGPAISTYWNAANTGTHESAKSYIPEIPWNDSCASKLIYGESGYAKAWGNGGFCSSAAGKATYLTTASGSGGPSAYSAQPAWQTGVVGLPSASGGHRYLPDVSLFAANGIWGHFYVFCMSDAAEGGVACNYANLSDTLNSAAGGTSFASPAMAGIQALVNQKTGSAQGNPNPTYYALAATEYGASGDAACNSSAGYPKTPVAPAASCIFYDVTAGDMDVPCTGYTDCFGYSKTGNTTYYGVLSVNSTQLTPAYPSGTGWDYATGLGTVNAANLVNHW